MQYTTIYNKNSKNTFTSKAKSCANAQQCDLYKNYTPACRGGAPIGAGGS